MDNTKTPANPFSLSPATVEDEDAEENGGDHQSQEEY